jgi:hypothetical protein
MNNLSSCQWPAALQAVALQAVALQAATVSAACRLLKQIKPFNLRAPLESMK